MRWAIADALRCHLQTMLAEVYEPSLACATSLFETRYGLMKRAATPVVLCPQLSDFEPKQIGGSIGAT